MWKKRVQRIQTHDAGARARRYLERVLQIGEVPDTPVMAAPDRVELEGRPPDAPTFPEPWWKETARGRDNQRHGDGRAGVQPLEGKAVIAGGKALAPFECRLGVTHATDLVVADSLELRGSNLAAARLARLQRERPTHRPGCGPLVEADLPAISLRALPANRDGGKPALPAPPLAFRESRRHAGLVRDHTHRLEQRKSRRVGRAVCVAPDVLEFRRDTDMIAKALQIVAGVAHLTCLLPPDSTRPRRRAAGRPQAPHLLLVVHSEARQRPMAEKLRLGMKTG